MFTVNSRQELMGGLESWVSQSYESLSEDQELEEGNTLLKTYVLEADRESYSEGVDEIEDLDITIRETNDDDLHEITLRANSAPVDFYLDEITNRFWALHTVEENQKAGPLVEKLVYPRFTQLDFPWLSNNLLEHIGRQEGGTFNSFSLKYKNEFRLDGVRDRDIERLSMRLWGDTAGPVLQTLRQNDQIRGSTPLSNIGIKKQLNGKTMIDNITYYSRFTARGDSLDGHLQQVRQVIDQYSTILDIIESDYTIGYEPENDGDSITGQAIPIFLDYPIQNIDKFCEGMFSSTEPFRLWGVRNQLDEEYYRVSAVDLHTGDKLSFEISPDLIRLYLPEGSCGNVVMRLYTNIQHHYDSQAELGVAVDGIDI